MDFQNRPQSTQLCHQRICGRRHTFHHERRRVLTSVTNLHGSWCSIRSSIEIARVNWSLRRPIKKQSEPPVKTFNGTDKVSTSATAKLEAKVRATLTQWEKVPQATSYQDWKQMLNPPAGAKLTQVQTILPPPPIPRHNAETDGQVHLAGVALVASELCVWETGRIDVYRLPTRIKIRRFFLAEFSRKQC
jgi:hypothetical protein